MDLGRPRRAGDRRQCVNAFDPLAKRMPARGRGVTVNVIGMGGKVASPTHLPGGRRMRR